MNGVLIAVGAEFFQFQTGGGVPTIFHRGIPGDTGGALIGIGAALSTFEGDD
jgi:hypothetical protein